MRYSKFAWAALFACLAGLPLILSKNYYLHLVIVIAIYAIVLLGMDLLVGYTGQVSLGHAAFFGIGAYSAGLLMMKADWPFVFAILASIVIASIFGLILAAASLRVSGPYLAMVTLAFGSIVQILINEMSWLTMGPVGLPVDKPQFFGSKLSIVNYYYVVLVILGLCITCVDRWAKSYLGRAFEALRDSPIATDCMGISVTKYKAYSFAISAALAGLAGGLYCVSEEYTSPNTYSFELSILFLLGVIFGGRKSRLGALIGATVVVMLPTVLDSLFAFRILALIGVVSAAAYLLLRFKKSGMSEIAGAVPPLLVFVGMLVFSLVVHNLNEHRLTIFGGLILIVVFYLPDGVMGLFRWIKTTDSTQSFEQAGHERQVLAKPPAAPLVIEGITMKFGGLTALNNVHIAVNPGSIHGLIGPNGSGKSTMMNILTGVYVPTNGQVKLSGEALQGKSSAYITQKGIARTFQNVQLFWEMSALQNVMVGLHRQFKGVGLLGLALGLPKGQHTEKSAALQAFALLRMVGLGDLTTSEARDLPYGKQRLLEIARALALNPSILLLDEPAAGLTAPDVAALVEVLHTIRSAGVTIVLIEHHVDMVMQLCDFVSVLDFGQKIADGSPQQVRDDPKVIAAYLGAGAFGEKNA